MAVYVGIRDNGSAQVSVDGALLPPRNDLKNHSPNGCEWGYAGSGPSQLALAVLAHHFHDAGDEQELADVKALALYHAFKDELVAKLPRKGWELDSHVVADTVQMIVRGSAEHLFSEAMRLTVENKWLNKNLDEAYTQLEDADNGAI